MSYDRKILLKIEKIVTAIAKKLDLDVEEISKLEIIRQETKGPKHKVIIASGIPLSKPVQPKRTVKRRRLL